MIRNGLIAGSLKSIISDGPKNLDLGIVTRSIVDDCIRVPKPDWDKYLPRIVEIGEILLKDRESERKHEREMAEKLLQMMLLKLKSEERKILINLLIECINEATTEQDKLAYLYLYYLVTKEPILER